jgi:hypothetical protein
MLEARCGADEANIMTALITPEDEPAVRLLVFGAALLAIAVRQATRTNTGISEYTLLEVHAIVDAVITEAKRLDMQYATAAAVPDVVSAPPSERPLPPGFFRCPFCHAEVLEGRHVCGDTLPEKKS